MRGRRSRFRSNNNLSILNIIKLVLLVLIIIFAVIFIFSSFNMKNKLSKTSKNTINNIENLNISNIDEAKEPVTDIKIDEAQENIPIQETSTTINMAFTGDIMCHTSIYNDAYDEESETYDFSYIFENVKFNIQTADIAVGNLETTFSGNSVGYSGYPKFNTPEKLAYNLKKLGFDVLSTANNHCYDYEYEGIESTINYLNDADISHTGTFKSNEEQNKILIKNVKGINIAFLSFTYGTNGINIPEDKAYSVNIIDKDFINNQISLAQNQKPDLICVLMHWGTEYQTTPNNEQEDLTNFLFENGADIIIGNHPHVLQPMEKREITLSDGGKKDGFVIYSLGNFLADQTKKYTRSSAIVNLNITKNAQNKISINSVKYTPIYINKTNSKNEKKFKIINLKNAVAAYEAGYTDGISHNEYKTFKAELSNVGNLLGDEIK